MHTLNEFTREEIIHGFRGFVGSIEDLVEMAQVATNSAESWRNLDVGVAAECIQPGESEPQHIVGVNYTVDYEQAGKRPLLNTAMFDLGVSRQQDENYEEGMDDDSETDPEVIEQLHTEHGIGTHPPKNCGELAVCMEADRIVDITGKSLYFPGFVIASTVEAREIFDITHVEAKTLTPCGDTCVPMLEKSPYISRATLFLSTGYSDGDIFQVRTLKDVIKLQKTRAESGAEERQLPRLRAGLGADALKIFDRRMKRTHIANKPSHYVSAIALRSLMKAGRER